MIFEKNLGIPHPVGTTQTPGLPLASATAKAVPAAVPVGLVKVQNGGRRISSERESWYSTRSPTGGSQSSTNFFD